MRIAERVQQIEPSATLSISARAKAMKQEGIDVISFSAGEPDFDTPLPIKEEAKKAIDQGFTKYTPTSGIPELKEAICGKLFRENGLSYQKEEIIVSCGAKHSLYNAIMTLCNPQDEVLLPRPYWVTYAEQIKLAGGIPVILECHPETLVFSLEELKRKITSRTRLLLLNNPSNPSGVVLEKEFLREIVEIIQHYDMAVISDEIYEHLVYECEFPVSIATFPGMKERTVIVNGVSKTFSMTGWRIGYAAGPKEVIKAMEKLQDHSTSNPTSISQKAAIAALSSDTQLIQEMVEKFNQRRKLMIHALQEIPGVTFPVPRGAFYLFANFTPYLECKFEGMRIGTSLKLAEILLEKAHIACVPGIAFGMEGYLRFSYATSEANIEKGMSRLRDFLIKL
ncbi:MAG: pyridoxal phosphate-dependent aminotransferase [Candidatus Atribacteria bacterium]|nr:pyridoxal phosphate-dependent aminotransferase [Candidatus Atribacteria bacterium]